MLIAPASSNATLKIAPDFGLAAALGTEKLAMANPDSVPAGKYGKSALEKLGVWASVEKQVARAENVRAALALVSRGEAPFGIVYSHRRAGRQGREDRRHLSARQPSAHRLSGGACWPPASRPAAKPLLDYLRSAPARAVWEKYGFGLAQ